MPTEWIHHPWDAPRSVLAGAGVELGFNYPKPVIDLVSARERLDDAVSTMWQLDRAFKLAMLSSDEVVADNSIYFRNNENVDNRVLDIPRVVVRQEGSCVSSSLDQKVPSLNNILRENLKTGNNNSNDGNDNTVTRLERNRQANRMEGSIPEEDVVSTAESSAGRKRSLGESSYAVPSAKFSLSDGDQMEECVHFDASMQSLKVISCDINFVLFRYFLYKKNVVK
jgi:cryptochrome 2